MYLTNIYDLFIRSYSIYNGKDNGTSTRPVNAVSQICIRNCHFSLSVPSDATARASIELSIAATIFIVILSAFVGLFFSSRTLHYLFIIFTSLSLSLSLSTWQSRDAADWNWPARAIEKEERGRERILARQPRLSGRCTPLCSLASESSTPRVIPWRHSTLPAIPGYPLARRHECNSGSRAEFSSFRK